MNQQTISIFRWSARLWSLFSIAFILLFLVGGGNVAEAAIITPSEWVGLLFFPVGLFVGLVLAWQQERMGGLITIFSLGAFYVWHILQSGHLPSGPFFIILAAPGLLFLITWGLDRRKANNSNLKMG